METRHIRLDYEKALDSKKQILSAELNLLHILKRIKNYNIIRKEELGLRNQIRTNFTSLKTGINSLQSSMPAIEAPKEDLRKSKEAKEKTKQVKKSKKDDIQIELEEIKKKLSKLG